MSIKKMSRDPIMLVDKVFEIPLFAATGQQYICTEVADLGVDARSKRYGVYLKWLPTSYSVPEVLRMDIEIFSSSNSLVNVTLYEKMDNGSYVVTCNGTFDRDLISTPSKIQRLITELINK